MAEIEQACEGDANPSSSGKNYLWKKYQKKA